MAKLPERLEFSLSFQISRLAQALRREQLAALKPFGLTPEQWQVLAVLWEQDSVSQGELAAITLRDEPSLSRMVRGMEANGWVERKIDPSNGRTRRLAATAKAWESREALFIACDARLRAIHSEWSSEAVGSLMEQARSCAELLERITGGRDGQEEAPAETAEPMKLAVETSPYSSGFAEKEIRSSLPFAQFFPTVPQEHTAKEAALEQKPEETKTEKESHFATPFNWTRV